MTYRGHVENGVVVFDGSAAPPDGTSVEIAILPSQRPVETRSEDTPSLGDKLLKFAGRAVGLPADASQQHDHYLYGTPKR